jgi:putative ATP-binding cassette transporter
VRLPSGASALFLPQRPYLPLGTLRRVLAYPAAAESFSEDAFRLALEDAGLAHLVARLDAEEPWAQRLSGGEQQRVALARVLLNRPDWLFLDEATASLDAAMERRFYELVTERLPDATVVSIAHRPGVAGFHTRRLVVEEGRLLQPAESSTSSTAAP